MISRLAGRLVYMGLTLLVVVANLLATTIVSTPVQAAGAAARVYLTLPDQSKLVERQADIPFTNNLAPGAQDLNVRVDPQKTFQTMDGVGATMTESSAYLFSTKLSAAQRGLVSHALFGKQNGAGIDVVRVPWGLTDFSLGEYTYNDNPGGGTDEPQSQFSINHDLQYLIPRLQDAKSVNPNLKTIMAPWSAPLWMKSMPIPDRPYAIGPLKPEYFDSYGAYLVKAINGYAANNLTPHAFSTQNEPFTPTFNPSMFFSPAAHQQLIRDNVGPKVAANSVKPQLLAHDDDWQDERDTANPMYAPSVLSDPNAAQYIDGVAYHCYHGESTRQLLVQKAHPTKNIYVTECTGSNTPPESWDDDFRWGLRNMIINPTRNYARSSLYWNLALDENAGPKTYTNAGCQNCRGVMTVTNAGGVAFNTEYYILAHYGKFIDPGAQRIDSTTYGEGSIETVAFKNPSGKKALIALNSGGQARTFTIREGNKAFRYTLPAGAAATFTWEGADNTKEDVDTGRIEAENYASSLPAGQQIVPIVDGGKSGKAVYLANNEELRFTNVPLQAVPMSFQIRYRTLGSGTIEFRQDSATGPLLGSVPFSPSDSVTSPVATGTVPPTAGTHTLYVVAKGAGSGELIELNWFKFAQTPASGEPVAGKAAWKAYGVFAGGTDVPANILDSNNATRWTTGFPMTYGHWLTIDLGKLTSMSSLGAYSQLGDRPHKLKIEVSDDGLNFTTVVNNYVPPADLYAIPFNQRIVGRYIRLTELSEDNPAAWWSMNEINLYNN
ncbi:MAG TPA: glycoside hydrolase family 30 beta sandwich domain-containing protein [Candidatus Limnocylindria bacterium]|nr:glycoside hydrolase family 30 beta sandwich domain-containing protein [Candidatus Limnocylindria bacterium]